jgi:serine/threonine protein kinase
VAADKRPESPNDSTKAPGEDGPDAARIRQVISEVVARRARGEPVPDADVIAAHPRLMPRLAEELSALHLVRRAMLAAQRAGPAQEPLAPLHDDQLEAPISVDEDDEDEPTVTRDPDGVLSSGASLTAEWSSGDADPDPHQDSPSPATGEAASAPPPVWRPLVIGHGPTGIQVHDARLVPHMRGHGFNSLLTLDIANIGRQPSNIRGGNPIPEALLRRAALRGYQILSEISRGGQAAVYKAIQESTGRKVAIKVLPGGALASSRSRARFDREARILAGLDHPNVVSIIDRGRTADGSFFLVMQFIDGCSLDEFAAESQIADADFPVRLLGTFAKVARAVDEAHARGVVHRDLKPSNVRVDSRGEPHLLDFGLARLLDDSDEFATNTGAPQHTLTAAGQVVGSLPWTSPEQASGKTSAVDRRSDIYALGVCLYQCLTGRFPYPVSGSITETLNHITSTPPGPLRWGTASGTVRLTRAADLEAVVNAALAKSPDDRYPTAADLASDIEAILAGQPVSAGARRFRRNRRRRRAFWATIIVAILLALAAGIYAYVR